MAARPGYNQLNPFSNQPQYARQYTDSDAESYTSRNASSVPLAPAGYYDGTYTPQRKCPCAGFTEVAPRCALGASSSGLDETPLSDPLRAAGLCP